ncbi:Dioxygenase [Hyella patelloides LEGE 07179]|uniref:Dioxygenase n=1 Tax=Hyella patelloides LEGE 07179 TaxID=945734 RepID=A0A563VKN2_9CYAN|nr:carotenoid oxygenase family protein [Hyella patelloides]VEP12004.1 Dioxygenase [Hyella patelloides LEGE 07179]
MSWQKAIANPAREFNKTPLTVISGAIPDTLRGTLYRNGPARLNRGKQRVGHLFDGDGAILGINFTAEGANATYKYVQTEGYIAESQAEKYLFPNYGMTAPGAFWNNATKPVKNCANISVLALSDRLLALWEGGVPHSLDLATLETIGTDNLQNTLNDLSFSAHPKVDAATGEIFNFGISPGKETTLNIYKSDATGKITKKKEVSLPGLPLMHDFALAGDYLVFVISPVRVNVLPVLLGRKSYSDAMEWKPQLGTQIWIFDRHELSLVSQGETDPWYQWHHTNGYVNSDGNIVIEFVRYEDFKTNQYLKEVATGNTKTSAKGTLWQAIINPQTAKVSETQQLLDRHCEFPMLAPQDVGQSWRYTYLSTHRDNVDISQELLTAIARFDRQTGNLSFTDLGANMYPSEPIYVSQPNNPDSGWLLTVVYDGERDLSEIRVYNSDRLEEEPVCSLALPSVIPPSFHGTWKNQS